MIATQQTYLETCYLREILFSISVYLDDFCSNADFFLQNSHLEYFNFLNDDSKLAMPYKSEISPYKSSECLDRLITSFLNELPDDLKLEIFSRKLLFGSRGNNILSFLSEMNQESYSHNDIKLTGFKDFSSGRACCHGHIVYEIELEVKSSGSEILYLKGKGAKESDEFEKFNGWNQGRAMHLYEAFFQSVIKNLGLSDYESRFYYEDHDSDILGYTLTKKKPGIHSDEFINFSNCNAFYNGTQDELLAFIKLLAPLEAVSNFLGKEDRSVFKSSKYGRSSNYLFDKSIPRVESIDHELLFSPKSFMLDVQNERKLLMLLDHEKLLAAQKSYDKAYDQQFSAISKGQGSQVIFDLLEDFFGENSFEYNYVLQNSKTS